MSSAYRWVEPEEEVEGWVAMANTGRDGGAAEKRAVFCKSIVSGTRVGVRECPVVGTSRASGGRTVAGRRTAFGKETISRNDVMSGKDTMSGKDAVFGRRSLLVAVGLMLTACAQLETTPPAIVHQPMSARPVPIEAQPATNGAIFRPQTRSLFEDRKPRYVGDILTINLVEKTSAKKNSSTNAARKSSASARVETMNRVPLSGLAGLGVGASSDNSIEGKGAAAADNAFQGTITVTVVDVLANGNLLVSGEKQIAINQGREYIRFSGVVNPDTISAQNTVESTQVADARIEYVGSGYLDEAQKMGWLQRFFMNVLPF